MIRVLVINQSLLLSSLGSGYMLLADFIRYILVVVRVVLATFSQLMVKIIMVVMVITIL